MRFIPLFSVAMACLFAQSSFARPLPSLASGSVFRQPVESAALHPNSQAMVDRVTALGGFGNARMQIDFSFYVLHADSQTPLASIVSIPGDPDPYFSDDCETLGSSMPLPIGGAIEGQSGYSCDVFNGDCHILVVDQQVLYENYRSNVVNNQVQSQCLVKWRLDAAYGPKGRGDHCTSADAAGFPIAPLLFNADDVAAQQNSPTGDLGHAIRFVMPNARMANDIALGGRFGRLYVRPATHAGGPSGPVDAIPYGARLRLKSTFNIDGYNNAAKVILRTMKRYGIVLADGGIVALTAENDRYTTAKWADLGISARTFDLTVPASKVNFSDFEVIDTGARIAETYNCVREPDPDTGSFFVNGFE